MSLTITAARWATPENTRALVQTAQRGAVLLKPERAAEWAAFQAWIAAGNVPAAYAPPVVGYRDRRASAYAAELGKDVGDIIKTIGDVLDVTIAELRARGASVTPEFASMASKIDAIKARIPKG
jgi:hypothetical protein